MSDKTKLVRFLAQNAVYVPGGKVRYSEMYRAFVGSLPKSEQPNWSKPRFSRALEDCGIVKGYSSHGQLHIANLELATAEYRLGSDNRLYLASI